MAESKEPLGLVDMLSLPTVAGPTISPDGSTVCYQVSESNWDKSSKRRSGHLFAVATSGKTSPVQLTQGKGESGALWSPDSRTVAFTANRDGDSGSQIYLLPAHGGEARRLTEGLRQVGGLSKWSADGWIYFNCLADPTPGVLDTLGLIHGFNSDGDKSPYVFEEDMPQRMVCRVHAVQGTVEHLTPNDCTATSWSVSRDGSKLVWHRAASSLLDDGRMPPHQIWLQDSDGSNARKLSFPLPQPASGGKLSPDGNQLLFTMSATPEQEYSYTSTLFLASVNSSAPAVPLPSLEGGSNTVVDFLWSATGDKILVHANIGVRHAIYQFDLAARTWTALTDTTADVSFGGWSHAAAPDTHVLSVVGQHNGGDICLLGDGGALTKLTNIFDKFTAKYALPEVQAITWEGRDGTIIEGLLYYPIGHNEGDPPAPLVVSTHGGPASSNVFKWVTESEYIPQLCTLGYFVLQPNYRGSTGYGCEFSDDVIGHYFNHMLPDVMAGVDHLINQNLVDPKRLGKRGYSAGGVLTKWTVTQTNRFKCASAGAGASSWAVMYMLGDLRQHREPWFGGPPWTSQEVLDKYWKDSPIAYVKNVKTPTLLHSGDRDERNPLWENLVRCKRTLSTIDFHEPEEMHWTLQMFHRALKGLSIPSFLYVYPGHAHGNWTLESHLMRANADLAWMEHYINGRQWKWEEPPVEYTNQPTASWNPVKLLEKSSGHQQMSPKL